MVLKKLLCLIMAMALYSVVRCKTEGYDRPNTCRECRRSAPILEPVEEDLFHLDHADPCYFDGVQWTKTKRQRAANLCGKLVQLYLASELYNGGNESKCKGAKVWGCVEYGITWCSQPMKCMVSFSNRVPKDLSKCVQDDLEGYQKRMEKQRAERKLQGMFDDQSGVGETSEGNPTKRRLSRKSRGGSRNPSKSSAGRSPSIFSPLFRSFRKTMRTKSQKSDTFPVG